MHTGYAAFTEMRVWGLQRTGWLPELLCLLLLTSKGVSRNHVGGKTSDGQTLAVDGQVRFVVITVGELFEGHDLLYDVGDASELVDVDERS